MNKNIVFQKRIPSIQEKLLIQEKRKARVVVLENSVGNASILPELLKDSQARKDDLESPVTYNCPDNDSFETIENHSVERLEKPTHQAKDDTFKLCDRDELDNYTINSTAVLLEDGNFIWNRSNPNFHLKEDLRPSFVVLGHEQETSIMGLRHEFLISEEQFKDCNSRTTAKREKDRIKKRELRSNPGYRAREQEKARIRMRERRKDPTFREMERQKDRTRRRIARQRNCDQRSAERERDKQYKRFSRLGLKPRSQTDTCIQILDSLDTGALIEV